MVLAAQVTSLLKSSCDRRWLAVAAILALLGVAAICLDQFKKRRISQARERAKVVAAIKAAGGSVTYQYQWEADLNYDSGRRAPLPGSAESRKRYGLDYVDDVAYVGFFDTNLVFGDIAQLHVLSEIKQMNLDGCQLTFETAAELTKLPKLEWLSLDRTSLTNSEVRRLAKLLPSVRISHPIFGSSTNVIIGDDLPPYHRRN